MFFGAQNSKNFRLRRTDYRRKCVFSKLNFQKFSPAAHTLQAKMCFFYYPKISKIFACGAQDYRRKCVFSNLKFQKCSPAAHRLQAEKCFFEAKISKKIARF